MLVGLVSFLDPISLCFLLAIEGCQSTDNMFVSCKLNMIDIIYSDIIIQIVNHINSQCVYQHIKGHLLI